MAYPPHLFKLIDALRRLPGVGGKTAERYAFELLKWPGERVRELAAMIGETPAKIGSCIECGVLIGESCPFCTTRKGSGLLCVTASPKEVFAIEETGQYKGLYQVLRGLLSPIEGRGPELLELDKLKNRLTRLAITEVILALDSTVEGDATALYLKQQLSFLPLKISRLAFGLPLGSPLDYVDGGTLAQALSGRHVL
ncbi:MAG: recombination mediator RecR [Parachlamydiales bacterium]